MAAQRPNVIVYQEYENLTVAPDIADLDVMVVGPCYQLLDYLDDKDDCYADDYGELNAACPMSDPSAVVMTSPPSIKPGAEVDATSVQVFFDEARAVIVEHGAAAQDGLYSVDDNLFSAHTDAGGEHFGDSLVEPGDILITQATGVDDYLMTVKEVIYVLTEKGTALKFRTNGVQPGDIVTLQNDNPPGGSGSRNGVYTVKRVRDDLSLEFVDLNWTGHYLDEFTGTETTTISITAANGAPRIASTVAELADTCDLRTTSDFVGDNPASAEWRVEREVEDVELDAGDYAVEDNEITVEAAITVDLSTALLDKKISYAKIYTQYAAIRTDLQVVNEFSNYTEMEVTLGKYDARNPLFVGAVVAKANTTTPITVYAVKGDTLTAYLDFIDKISTVRDIYSIVPLTYKASILAALNQMCEQLSDPNYVLTAGIKQKFRVTIGAVELTTQKYMVNESGGGSVTEQAGTAPEEDNVLTFSQGVGTVADFSAAGVIPGDTVTVHDGVGDTTYTVAQLNGVLILEADGEITGGTFNTVGDYFEIKGTDAVVKLLREVTGVPSGDDETDTFTIAASQLDDLALLLQVPGAGFITSGCIPGDIVQIPSDPMVDSWTTYGSWVIDEVISEERVRVMDAGTNTSQLANELPHLYKRIDGSVITDSQMYYRVMRNLTKSQQVDEMVAVATSFGSKRLVLCYPDEVDVSGLVDGGLTRTDPNTPETAAAQPGYYLSCAVGGMTAGQPPQQGFTNKGIAGIDRVYNAGEYFKEEQLTELSNGGVYVFIQDTPGALPYSIHEVTTDVTALEFSEYMVVKNFDFVAWTYLDTMLPFLGEWNVIDTTVEFIRQALVTTGDTLKARYVAKIGAPLTNYSIDGVEQSELSTDRIEAFVDVDLPMTLNTIGLHLVA
jgi:hypothetical protein